MTFNLESFIEEYKAPETFVVTLPGGHEFKFKTIKSHTEFVGFTEKAKRFIKLTQGKSVPKDWKQFQPIHPETANKAFTVSELSLEPKFSQLDALRLAQEVPFVLETFFEKLEINRSAVFAKIVDESLDEGKED
ncbi:MAG TPA: hypothetical protein VK171_01550 [Fimbriimonas sp.]|nr:hypothetical protein [Fimbriimonas sp.]